MSSRYISCKNTTAREQGIRGNPMQTKCFHGLVVFLNLSVGHQSLQEYVVGAREKQNCVPHAWWGWAKRPVPNESDRFSSPYCIWSQGGRISLRPREERHIGASLSAAAFVHVRRSGMAQTCRALGREGRGETQRAQGQRQRHNTPIAAICLVCFGFRGILTPI